MQFTVPFIRTTSGRTANRRQILEEANAPDRKTRNYIENVLRVPINTFADDKSYLEAGCKRVWASFRACHLTASLIQSTQFELAIKDDTDAEVKDPLANRYLRRPNPHDSWAELIYQWTYHMKLVGKGYWLKDEINGFGQPENLYPLMPQYMILHTHPTNGIDHFEYRVNGHSLKLDPEEVIYFRRPHPMKVLQGMGDIEPSEALYNRYINRGIYEEKFIEQGASPSGILALKEADPDETDFANLKARWRREYEGKKNIGKTAILSGEYEYHKLGLTHAEMQNIEADKLTVDQIFMNHGVPLSVAGIEKATSLATARQDEINFKRFEVVPLAKLLTGKLNADGQLFTQFGDGQVRLNFKLSGLINVQQIVEDYLPLVKMGTMTPNELRVECGLERVDNPFLNQYFLPTGYVPIELAGFGDAPTGDEELKQAILDAQPSRA